MGHDLCYWMRESANSSPRGQFVAHYKQLGGFGQESMGIG